MPEQKNKKNERNEENDYEKNKDGGIRNDDGVIHDCVRGKGRDEVHRSAPMSRFSTK